MIEITYFLFVLMIAVSLGCAVWRVWRGPTVADRINAADVVAICVVGLAIGQGWKAGDGLWLDVAMVAGLVLFVGTTAVSLFITSENLSDPDE